MSVYHKKARKSNIAPNLRMHQFAPWNVGIGFYNQNRLCGGVQIIAAGLVSILPV
jgi:hypothetical protein